ncbi:fimbria/pilus outer membrane usher protein [Variovorax sp. J22R133]|uniref:fimbria/pilus outer membrane usher protein n=1 Tax=Variovorax brevis TaxID=3053503 RepID=UPI0025783815|nr:fimbria/pilus outer membrane usher protein [Variovorax sp. J22R133]MDM0117586.1 fimbria/pilus outer membrane usher protein [Variovorax sp. J22R133]
MAVSLLEARGPAVQLRVQDPLQMEPVVTRSGAVGPGPYRVALEWPDIPVTLTKALPPLPPEGIGPLKALALHSTATGSRLELEISEAVEPRLRRVADSWVLQLEPILKPPTPAVAAALTPGEPAAASPVVPRARRGSRAGAAASGTPRAQWLLLDVTVNARRLNDVARAELRPDGTLLLPANVWADARLAKLDQTSTLSDGTPGYALGSLAGATYRIDRRTLNLEISAPASAFIGSTLELQDSATTPPPRPRPGAMLNYDVSMNHARGDNSGGAMLEAVAFSGFGNIVASALLSKSGSGARVGTTATRLDTYWRYDLPDRMETVVVGDTIGVAGGWSRPVRYGGVRWGRDFGTQPGFVTLPQISLAGEAALPSTVEVLVNNARRSSQPLQPGPFDLPNVPIVTGAGEVGLVVRDLLGRETVVSQSYYASPRLLAPQLSDFSFEAGWLRTGYGGDSAYAHPFGAGTWREGLTNTLTGEMRLELQRDRGAAGAELSSLLGNLGVGRVAAAASSGDPQGLRESGLMMQAGIERSSPSGGGALQYEHASRDFAPFGESIAPAVRLQRVRDRWLATLGGPLWGVVSGGLSYVSQNRWDGERMQLLGLSLNMPLWQRASLSMSVNKRLDGQDWSASMLVSLPLEGGVHTAARIERDISGDLNGTLAATRNPPAGPGLGWRVEAATEESPRAQAGMQYNTSQAEWALDAVADSRGQVATRVGGRGTVGWLEGMAFASRPVGQGSVAVVKMDGVEGVPVMRSHQVIAVTDARGLAFVPGLLPWQKNLIEIDPVDLPLDVEVASTSQEVLPFARSGMAVDFMVKRTRQALLVLRQRDGTPVPVGTRLRLLPVGLEFSAGRRGEVWLTDLAETRQRVQVSWSGGGCALELAVPISVDGVPGRIGPLICDEGNQ